MAKVSIKPRRVPHLIFSRIEKETTRGFGMNPPWIHRVIPPPNRDDLSSDNVTHPIYRDISIFQRVREKKRKYWKYICRNLKKRNLIIIKLIWFKNLITLLTNKKERLILFLPFEKSFFVKFWFNLMSLLIKKKRKNFAKINQSKLLACDNPLPSIYQIELFISSNMYWNTSEITIR